MDVRTMRRFRETKNFAIDEAFGDPTTSTGVVEFASVSGGSGSVAIPTGTTAYTWFDDVISVDTEDQTTADGRRSTRWDEVTFTFNRTAGAGTLYVAGRTIVEE